MHQLTAGAPTRASLWPAGSLQETVPSRRSNGILPSLCSLLPPQPQEWKLLPQTDLLPTGTLSKQDAQEGWRGSLRTVDLLVSFAPLYFQSHRRRFQGQDCGLGSGGAGPPAHMVGV